MHNRVIQVNLRYFFISDVNRILFKHNYVQQQNHFFIQFMIMLTAPKYMKQIAVTCRKKTHQCMKYSQLSISRSLWDYFLQVQIT